MPALGPKARVADLPRAGAASVAPDGPATVAEVLVAEQQRRAQQRQDALQVVSLEGVVSAARDVEEALVDLLPTLPPDEAAKVAALAQQRLAEQKALVELVRAKLAGLGRFVNPEER